MLKSRHLVSLIMLCCLIFMFSHFNGNHYMAIISRACIVPLFTILYFVNNKNKSPYFLIFLIAYSISDLISIVGYKVYFEWEYYIGNSLYIVGYLAFSFEILSSISMKHILSLFRAHVLVLMMFNIYLNYVLIMYQSDTTYFTSTEYFMELLYNISTLILVSVSLLNYFYRDDKKALVLFLGSLSIAVSEVIQITYYYLMDTSESNILNVSYSLFLILGFYFYYMQSKLDYDEVLVVA